MRVATLLQFLSHVQDDRLLACMSDLVRHQGGLQ